MARKVHTKKVRSRQDFLAAKSLGAPVIMNTPHGNIALNTWKHFCLHKPYENDVYETMMFAEIRRRKDAYEKSRTGENNG